MKGDKSYDLKKERWVGGNKLTIYYNSKASGTQLKFPQDIGYEDD